MPKKGYKGFDSWDKMLSKYEDVDFSDPKIRKKFRKDFEKVSKLMWKTWIENSSSGELAEAISEAWCSGIEKSNTMKENYEEAYGYCYYASDRMNINRWMRIRILLNYDVE